MVSILKAWEAVRRAPFGLGPWLFSWLVMVRAPYSASVSPRVIELREGFCRVQITERPWLKNPFNSIHAVALMNVGELASGLTVMSALEAQGLRGIVTKLDTEYFKKAKGTVTAVAKVDTNTRLLPVDQETTTMQVTTDIFNKDNELVARSTAWWTVRAAKKH